MVSFLTGDFDLDRTRLALRSGSGDGETRIFEKLRVMSPAPPYGFAIRVGEGESFLTDLIDWPLKIRGPVGVCNADCGSMLS